MTMLKEQKKTEDIEKLWKKKYKKDEKSKERLRKNE